VLLWLLRILWLVRSQQAVAPLLLLQHAAKSMIHALRVVSVSTLDPDGAVALVCNIQVLLHNMRLCWRITCICVHFMAHQL
jgi:hypothetical protein